TATVATCVRLWRGGPTKSSPPAKRILEESADTLADLRRCCVKFERAFGVSRFPGVSEWPARLAARHRTPVRQVSWVKRPSWPRPRRTALRWPRRQPEHRMGSDVMRRKHSAVGAARRSARSLLIAV